MRIMSNTFESIRKHKKPFIFASSQMSEMGYSSYGTLKALGEKITKDLNPSYGSIQALKTRDRDVVVFTEDKTLKDDITISISPVDKSLLIVSWDLLTTFPVIVKTDSGLVFSKTEKNLLLFSITH